MLTGRHHLWHRGFYVLIAELPLILTQGGMPHTACRAGPAELSKLNLVSAQQRSRAAALKESPPESEAHFPLCSIPLSNMMQHALPCHALLQCSAAQWLHAYHASATLQPKTSYAP